MAKFRIIVEERRELEFNIEANSAEEARALWENGEVSVIYDEIDGSQSTTFVQIEEINGNQELINSIKRISKESFVDVYSVLEDAENAFIKIEEESYLARRALQRLCVTAISILAQQYEEKDLLKFMDSRNHWKIPLNSKDEIKREITNLMKQVIENSEHKTGISMKPIFRLLATAEKVFK